MSNTTPPNDDPNAAANEEDAWTDDDARTDDVAVTGGDAAAAGPDGTDGGTTDAGTGAPSDLADYDAMTGTDPLPDFILPRTGTDDPDDDSINITEHEGPDLNAGNDVDAGAGGTGS